MIQVNGDVSILKRFYSNITAKNMKILRDNCNASQGILSSLEYKLS